MSDISIKFKKSAVLDKKPDAEAAEYGEVFLNFNAGHPFLSTKDTDNSIRVFSDDETILAMVEKRDVDLTEYYTKAEINEMLIQYLKSVPAEYVTEAELAAKNYLTSSSLGSYYTMSQADNKFQPKGNYLTQHQSLEAYETKTHASSTYQPKGNYATKSEIPTVPSFKTINGESITGSGNIVIEGGSGGGITEETDPIWNAEKNNYLKKTEASSTYQPKGNYLTEHQSLTEYAKKSDIPAVPTKVSELTNDAGYLTSHQDISGKADVNHGHTISEITDYVAPDLTPYETKEHASETYQPKGNYITEHQDISGKADVNHGHTISEITDYVAPDLTPYETKEHAESAYQPKGDYLTEHQSLDGYAKSEDIPTIPSFKTINGEAITGEGDIVINSGTDTNEYEARFESLEQANANVISNQITFEGKVNEKLAEFMSADEVDNLYVSKVKAYTKYFSNENWYSAEKAIAEALASFNDGGGSGDGITEETDPIWNAEKGDYLKKTEASEAYQPKGDYLTEHQDISGKADVDHSHTMSDITDYVAPDLTSYETKEHAENAYQPKGDYLTEHQSLDNYYSKTEIDSLVGNIDTLLNNI